jgi:hypothetical protein
MLHFTYPHRNVISTQNRHNTLTQKTAHLFVTYYIRYVHEICHCYGNPKLHNDNDKSDTTQYV